MGQFHLSVFGLILRAMRSHGVWILRSDCLEEKSQPATYYLGDLRKSISSL